MPNFSATNPSIDIIIATTHQENPLINPEMMLLYSGKTFCAKSIVAGVASIVRNPINKNMQRETIGNLWHVNTNKSINGNVEIIEI